MQETRKWIALAVLFPALGSCGCSYYRYSYSILESVPYVNQNSNVSPEVLDGTAGIGIGIGAEHTWTNADPDTTTDVFSPSFSFRARLAQKAEFGFTSSFIVREGEALPYGILDGKVAFVEDPVIVTPNLGFGLGYGYASFMWDLRTSLVIGVPLLNRQVIPYLAPRFSVFTYPYERSGYIILSPEWTSCIIGGFDAGLGLSFPVVQQADNEQYLKVRPHLSWLRGKEPKLDKVDFQILEIGANMVYAF